MYLTWSALVCAALMAAVPVNARAENSTQASAERELESRVKAADANTKTSQGPIRAPLNRPVTPERWQDAAGRLIGLAAMEDPTSSPAPGANSDCSTSTNLTDFVLFAGKYAIQTSRTTGRPCKLFDLSFPTLKSFGRALAFSALPTQKYTAADYINWLNGHDDRVQRKLEMFERSVSTHGMTPNTMAPNISHSSDMETADWVQDLRFRETARTSGQTANFGPRSLPQSFRASDLDIGKRFVFSARDRQRLKTLVSILRQTGTPDDTIRVWTETAEHPERFLDNIRFDWNDARKVYDIALEADFLPLNGPVALIDYQAPHKPAVERLIRSVMGSALQSLARLIPHVTTRNIVEVAIEDSFDFIEMMYAYQYNQLEDTLRAALEGKVPSSQSLADLRGTMNLMFGARSDIMSQYVMALAQGQRFDWTAIESIGKRARYGTEKARDVMTSDMNSRLALKKNCEMQIIENYFGICSRGGKKIALHSLVSRHSALFWSFGPPLVHKYDSPAEVPLKRAASYLLSVGVRVMNIGVGRTISRNLASALKDFAFTGMMDEALLRNRLWLEQHAGATLDSESEALLKSLYRQNLNPFLPHGQATENAYIQINSQILGQTQGGRP